ncbi:hypothetical protein ATO7_01940 [Oceanococcus atlanticus]|uniref:Uncharacterized protein n=1 Tax=Oceanococcus atlanticus TaxID=1317117 RepID=A0A1Y1SG12_9GAMM|nr:gluconate 2-dehydrogenase subunit 3 family protein [Oceanococcus atlanticus]ORE88597.1 hypothetical protein ATO7_01940 [Oceanococcus atlanticus]
MSDSDTLRMPQRRVVLQSGGVALMSAWLMPLSGCQPGSGGRQATLAAAQSSDQPATPHAAFLSENEKRSLRALCDRLIPAGLQPGAAAGHAEEAIDALLAAFNTDPPLIYAGGPFSDRAGASSNNFARFLALDEYETLAWRLVIEGSQGRPEREFNGPVQGLQQRYREGLAHLDARAAQLATGVLPAALGQILQEQLSGTPLSAVLDLINQLSGSEHFADLPALLRDVIVFDPSDAQTQALIDVAFPNTLDGLYGAPEYGGNRDLVGWTSTDWPGDVQPRGYTDSEVINRDQPGLFDAFLPPSYGGQDHGPANKAVSQEPRAELPPLLIVAGESLAANIMAADGSLAALRQRLSAAANPRPEWVWRADHA